MTVEKMTLAEALTLAIEQIDAADHEAAAVLRSFREKGLPFYEAALAFVVQMKVVRALTTEGE